MKNYKKIVSLFNWLSEFDTMSCFRNYEDFYGLLTSRPALLVAFNDKQGYRWPILSPVHRGKQYKNHWRL